MTPEIKDIATRISALEWVLEVMLANELAKQPEEATAQFKKYLASGKMVLPPNSGPVDTELLEDLSNRTNADLKNFLRKVSKREAEIRAEREE